MTPAISGRFLSYDAEHDPVPIDAPPQRRLIGRVPTVQPPIQHTSHEPALRLLLPQRLLPLLILMFVGPGPSYDQIRVQPFKGPSQNGASGPAREIKQFTVPTIQLKGTAEEIGIDSRALADILEKKFVQEFAFLQTDFTFEKTYETWEIGLFGCAVWTVGNHYPIAFHIQCGGGSMDEPRHWQYETLGYGHKDKIVEMVRTALETIVVEYASFIRKARDGKA